MAGLRKIVVFVSLLQCGCALPKNRNLTSTVGATSQIKEGYVVSLSGQKQRVAYVIRDGEAVVGGDIVYPLSMISQDPGEVNLSVADARKWPNGRVPYVVDDGFKHLTEVKFMIAEWQKAGINWVPKGRKDKDYVLIKKSKPIYCGWAHFGKVGGKQILAVSDSCNVRTSLLHESAHTLGFEHEHQRPDRDSFVIVEPAGGAEGSKIQTARPLSPFDVDSVTMYDSFETFPKVKKIDGGLIQPPVALSAGDIQGARSFYNK